MATLKELRATGRSLASETERTAATLLQLTEEIVQAKKRAAEEEKKLADLQRAAAKVQNQIFARRAIPRLPKSVIALREKILADTGLSKDPNGTVGKQAELQQAIREDRATLQKDCPHPFVFSYDGYAGSRTDDYDDAYPGRHLCPVCMLEEVSASTHGGRYDVLKWNNSRLILRDLRNAKERQGSAWLSLKFLTQLFEDSAGGINLQWPSEADTHKS